MSSEKKAYGEDDLSAAMNMIDAVYGTVFDQDRFDELVDLSARQILNPSERDRFATLKEMLEGHLERAEEMLVHVPAPDINGIDALPEFLIGRQGDVLQTNNKARALFSITDETAIDDLNLSIDERTALSNYLKGSSDVPPVLRLSRNDTSKPYLMFVERARAQTKAELRIFGTDALWGERASNASKTLFGLSPSEAEVLGHILSGLSPAEVATERGRSLETVRQQIRSMIAKTQTHGIQGLARLGSAIAQSAERQRSIVSAPGLNATRDVIALPNGRTTDYIWQGAPDGTPVVFLHGCLCGNRFPTGATEYFHQNGIRLIAPARPYHGQTSGHDAMITSPERYAPDLLYLLDHLGVDQFHLLAFDTGAIVSLSIADALRDRITGVTCVGAQPPMRSWRDFASAPPQQSLFAVMPTISLPLLRFLAKAGDRRLKRDGADGFAKNVFLGADADLRACDDAELLNLFWEGHLFHVENGSDGFINDCRLVAAPWANRLKLPDVPIHFVHGELDVSVAPDRIFNFAKEVDAEVTIIPDAGHSAIFSHWPKVFELVSRSLPNDH